MTQYQIKKLLDKKYLKAFTLVELIVVITILAILGTIAFVSFSSYSSSARDSVRISDITNTKKALELFNIKAGTYPIPDGAESFSGGVNNTGSIINQGVLGDNASRNIGLSKTIVDPLTTEKYIYSTFSNGLYYQIASSLENDNLNSFVIPENSKNLSGIQNKNKSSSFLSWIPDFSGITELEFSNIANAVDNNSSTFKTTKVEGNYKMDPSLPSLIVVPSSVTGSGIFDPSVCFVVNGGTNTIESNSGTCQKKSEMSLKDFDSSLVGYWDMETYYQTTYSGVNNVVFLKDLSGNNYDIVGKKTANTYYTGIITSSGNIFTGSINGKGIIFDSEVFNGGFQTIKSGLEFSYNGRNITSVNPNFLLSNYTNSGGELIPGFSSSIVFNYNKELAKNWWTKRMVSYGLSNNILNIDSGDFLKQIDAGFTRFNGDNLHYFISPYNDGTGGIIIPYTSLKGCGINNNILDSNDVCWDDNFSIQKPNTINGKNIIFININFKDNTYNIYLNGVKIIIEKIPYYTIKRFQEPGYKFGNIRISSSSGEPFSGIIDDVKIYNRALSDEEIRQQAKIAGF